MVAYNFRPEYEERIRALIKTTTIRARGQKRHARPREWLQLYSGMRTRNCRKIIADPMCTQVLPIEICDGGVAPIWLDGEPLTDGEADQIALYDGFDDLDGLLRTFRDMHGLPFEGVWIVWRPVEQERG